RVRRASSANSEPRALLPAHRNRRLADKSHRRTIPRMACKDQGDLPFLAYVDKLMDQLHHNVPKALREFDAEAIHDARVATRRLKAAVDLVQPCLTQNRRKPLEKQ